MTDWQRNIDLRPEWGLARGGEITIQELAKSIADKLSRVAPFDGQFAVNEEMVYLEEEFRALSADGGANEDDLDSLMDELYDWADTKIGGQRSDTKRVCWIKTF